MRTVLPLLAVALAVSACGPAHLRSLGAGGERDMGEVFLGGWDGKRLRVFNDTVIEPGQTSRDVLVDALKSLDGDRYVALWVSSGLLDDALAVHDAFCETELCVIVFDRRGGSRLAEWGAAVAVFELTGADHGRVGSVWLASEAIRPPGPDRWSLRCLDVDGVPVAVHPDGGAIYPERIGAQTETRYALFDRAAVPEVYRKAALLTGFQAPNEATCDHDKARLGLQPEPEKPRIDVGASLDETPAP